MEPPLHRIGIPDVAFMVLLSFLLIFPEGAIAQDQTSGGGNQLHDLTKTFEQLEIQKTEQASPTQDPVVSGVDINSLDGDYTIFEHDQMWNRNPNPNQGWNFPLFEQGEPAGNIDGDDSDDFIVTGQTNEVEGTIWKTAVFLEDGQSKEPDHIVDRKLVPVGDLNGDGYADAIAVDDPEAKSVEIYEGMDSGYRRTGSTLENLDPAELEILGFVDFDGDGCDDIYAYSQESEDLILAFGKKNFSDMTVEPPEKVLSNTSKKVLAHDIDQEDEFIEIVEFSNSNENSYELNIQALKVEVEDLALSFEAIFESISFTLEYSSSVSNTDLHLIDVNDNGHDDIYISLGRDSPKYIMEYDPETGTYQREEEIFDGELVPAGDLNGDGMHDFIMRDPDNNGAPYIAYGSADLSSNISLDVQLEGDPGSNWSWEMDYNPYSGFGDLNGDGIDDVLLAHTENSNNDIITGRRLLKGSETESDNSEFQLYPVEYFFNRIYEVEELEDISGDGIDDFAMAFADEGKVEIYFGGSSISDTPDQVINSSIEPGSLASGDYNGDGMGDLMFVRNDGQQVAIYFGGSSINNTPDITLSTANINSDKISEPSFEGVYNIGDVNNDGSEDILATALSSPPVDGELNLSEAYLYSGGDISADPDVYINLPDQVDEKVEDLVELAGVHSTGLGDINNDGIDDLAIGVSGVSNENYSIGTVGVFYGGKDKSFSEPDIILMPEDYVQGFGNSIVAGDFNGNGQKDIAVSSIAIMELTDLPAVHLYYISENSDSEGPLSADRLLDWPLNNPDARYIQQNNGHLEVIPDFNNDDKDELLLSSTSVWSWPNYSDAAIYTFNQDKSDPAGFLRAPNQDAGLGGEFNSAIGDFTGNGNIDVVMSQPNDNNDALQSSRVYRYELTPPLQVTSVEDVPEDEGYAVELTIDGYLLSTEFDYLTVKHRAVESEDSEWADIEPADTIASIDISNKIEVNVPTTQPHNSEADSSYIFLIEVFGGNELLAQADTVKGRAFDNIAPNDVQGVEIIDENDSKVISWQNSDTGDLDTYLVYSIEDDGELSPRPLAVVEETEFTLPDNFDGVQNFVVGARDIHNNIGGLSLPITAVYPKTVTYDFNTDWNLITLAVDDDSAKSALKNLSSGPIYEYNGGYQEVEQIEEGVAYWIKFTDAQKPEFRGLPLTQLSLELREGWNLIGGIGAELPVSFIDDPDEIIIPETIYSFDNAYINTDTLGPTQGYWIRSSSAGTVTLTHPRFIEQQSEELNKTENPLAKTVDDITESFNKITLSGDEHSTELYFGQKLPKEIDKRRYTLPPMPPGDVFDARFEGDRRLAESDKVELLLNSTKEKPLKMKIEAGAGVEETQFVVKEFADGELQAKHTVNDSEETSLKHNATDSITLTPVGISEVSQQKAPDEFDLEQNYPNPFNPTTQIQYSVAEATDVKIDVFNVIGRRITTLVNERQQPGIYEVTFDGSNFASGIYLYRLQAGDYLSTKKFILAK